jgi:hypothetical protein
VLTERIGRVPRSSRRQSAGQTEARRAWRRAALALDDYRYHGGAVIGDRRRRACTGHPHRLAVHQRGRLVTAVEHDHVTCRSDHFHRMRPRIGRHEHVGARARRENRQRKQTGCARASHLTRAAPEQLADGQ